MGDRRSPGGRCSTETNSQSSPANRLAQLSRRVSQVPRTPRSVGSTTSKMRQPQFGSNRQLPCSTNPPVDIISAIEAARRCMRDLKKALVNLSKIEESRQCARYGPPLTFGIAGDDDPMAVSTPQETMVSPSRSYVAAAPSPSIRGVSSHRVAQNQFSDGAPLNTEVHSATSGSSVASTPRQYSRPSETDVEPIPPILEKHSSSAKEVPRRVAKNPFFGSDSAASRRNEVIKRANRNSVLELLKTKEPIDQSPWRSIRVWDPFLSSTHRDVYSGGAHSSVRSNSSHSSVPLFAPAPGRSTSVWDRQTMPRLESNEARKKRKQKEREDEARMSPRARYLHELSKPASPTQFHMDRI